MIRNILKPIAAAARRFPHEDKGTVLVETVIVLPALLWAFLGTYVFFDAFSAQNTSQRAAYTVSDLISRQTKVLTATDIEGMNKVFDFINDTSFTKATTHIRVTDLYYDYKQNRFRVNWSDATRGNQALTSADLNALASKLPMPANGDTEILVETWMSYKPAFNVGIDARTFTNFIVTRPRLSPDVSYSKNGNNGNGYGYNTNSANTGYNSVNATSP